MLESVGRRPKNEKSCWRYSGSLFIIAGSLVAVCSKGARKAVESITTACIVLYSVLP